MSTIHEFPAAGVFFLLAMAICGYFLDVLGKRFVERYNWWLLRRYTRKMNYTKDSEFHSHEQDK